MPIGGREKREGNNDQQDNSFRIPREAISPVSENNSTAQAEAREKINFLAHYLTKGVSWPPREDLDFDTDTLIKVLNILRPGLPSTSIERVPAQVLSFRLRVVRELIDIVKRFYPDSPRLNDWKQYDYALEVERAWKEVQTLFSLPIESLRSGLEKAAQSVKLLYEHDPVALQNILSWEIETIDSDALQEGLFK